VVAARAIAADAPQVGVDQRAAERGVDPAQGRLARVARIDTGIRDHEPDLIVLEQEVADPADRVGSADRLVERTDALGARVRRRVVAAGDQADPAQHRQPGPGEPPQSASSAASCMRSLDSARAACSTTWVACSWTRMRWRGRPSTAPTVCSITRSVAIRLDGSRMPNR